MLASFDGVQALPAWEAWRGPTASRSSASVSGPSPASMGRCARERCPRAANARERSPWCGARPPRPRRCHSLFRRGGVAKPRERLLPRVRGRGPVLFAFLPHRLSLIAGLAVTLGLIVWLLRGRTLALHGAEHRAIAAAEERQLAETWRGAVRPTRFAARCGTNFAALVFLIALALQRVWPFAPTVYASAAVVILSLALTMELWLAVEASTKRFARALLLPGLGLQRITTREPRLEETRVALRAVESAFSRESSHRTPLRPTCAAAARNGLLKS